jgi:PAS domain S-box-containing protein
MQTLLQGISGANSALLQDIDINQSLQNTIEILGKSTDVDRCYIFTNKKDEDGVLKLYYSYEWCNDGVEVQHGNPDLSGISYEGFPGMYEKLIADLPYYGLVKDNDNPFFKEIMEFQDIKAYLFTPIFCDGDFWGWIGYDDCRLERIWHKNEAEALFSVARNIGIRLQREKSEENFLKTKQHFDLSILASQQGMWSWDISNNKIEFSKIYMSMLGYEQYEFDHSFDSWDSRLHPEDHDRVINSLNEYINNKTKSYSSEFRLKHKKGHYVWIRDTGIATREENGEVTFMVGSHIDITKIKEQQADIENQRNEYDNVINNLAETVFRLNDMKEFIFLNTFWKTVSGYDKEESLNHLITEYILPDDIAYLEENLNEIKNLEGKASIFEVRLRQKDGHVKWIQIIARSTVDIDSRKNNITGSIVQINEIKEAQFREKELLELKSNFVTMASHQFRTPLTVIYSNLELLDNYSQKADINLAKKLISLSTRTKTEVDRLTELMNNILIFGRNNTNEPILNTKKVKLSKLVHSVVNNYFSSQLDGRKVIIKEDMNNKKILIDEIYFNYILTNILSNAFKYSKESKDPELSIHYDKDVAIIKITDFGIGIPKDDLNKLFTSFFRASNTSTIPGSGLGLVVAKQFMELHNGKIEIDSELDKGTTVTLTLPCPND